MITLKKENPARWLHLHTLSIIICHCVCWSVTLWTELMAASKLAVVSDVTPIAAGTHTCRCLLGAASSLCAWAHSQPATPCMVSLAGAGPGFPALLGKWQRCCFLHPWQPDNENSSNKKCSPLLCYFWFEQFVMRKAKTSSSRWHEYYHSLKCSHLHFNFEPVQSFSDEDLASQDRFQSVRYLQCDSILPVGGSSL